MWIIFSLWLANLSPETKPGSGTKLVFDQNQGRDCMSLSQRVVIVTGAGSGIGRGTAALLASEGACIVVAEINAQEGVEVASDLTRAGATAKFIATDVSDEQSVQRMLAITLKTFGSLYGLVNNAGIETTAHLVDTSTQDWDRVLAVNLRGVFLCSRA